MTQPQWPHLENLDRVLTEYDPDFLKDDGRSEWVVTEKVHGFNARFGITLDGTPWCGSRNNVVAEGDPQAWPDTLQGFVRFAAEHVMGLQPGETLFGEWAGKGVQKGIDYGERNFYAFGAMTETRGSDNPVLYSWAGVVWAADSAHVDVVPVLSITDSPPDLEVLSLQREQKSSIAEQGREGVVIFRHPVTLNYGRPLIAKFKAPGFAEVAKAPKAAKELPDLDRLASIADRYCTPQRMEHVLAQVQEHLAYNVGTPDSNPLAPEATGLVMREMVNDIIREAGSEYDELSDDAKKSFGKFVNPRTKRLLDDARMAAAQAVAA